MSLNNGFYGRTAIHESGHAIVARVLGKDVLSIAFGFGQFQSDDDWPDTDIPDDPLSRIRDDIAISLAGRVAQEMLGFIEQHNWRPTTWDQGPDEEDHAKQDYRLVSQLLTEAVDSGMINEGNKGILFHDALLQCRGIISISENQVAIRTLAITILDGRMRYRGLYPTPPELTVNTAVERALKGQLS